MGRPAPSCRAALEEATRLFPKRSRLSDGLCGDAAHAKRRSDHNPNADGWCTAFDLTADPDNGCDAHAMVRQLVEARDPRVKYVISQGRTASRFSLWRWRPYLGTNRHNKHAHVSIRPEAIHDTRPWWGQTSPPPPPPPVTVVLEDVMSRVKDAVDAMSDPHSSGVYVLSRDGGVFAFGGAIFYGSYHDLAPHDRQGERAFMVIESLTHRRGYRLLADDGAAYDFA